MCVYISRSINFVFVDTRIWIVGSSIIKRAFCQTRHSIFQTHLELERHRATIFWQGKGGMKWGEIMPKIKCLLKVEDPPNFLVLHCGGNNIPGDKGEKSVDLRLKINNTLVSLAKLLPDTVLVWSQILPRQHWRGGVDQEAMDMVRKRLNSFVATALIRTGGKYIRYPEIQIDCPHLFAPDGVHLSELGNQFFLYRLQQALQTFITKPTEKVSPKLGEFGPWLCYD